MCFTFIKLCNCCKESIDCTLGWNQFSMFNSHIECGLIQNCLTRVYSVFYSEEKCLTCENHSSVCKTQETFRLVLVTNVIESVYEEM